MLKENYEVFYQDVLIAELKEPDIPDQFWVDFRLIPLIADPLLLEILYDDHSWTDLLTIKEKDTQKPVQFILEIDYEETEEEVFFRNILKSRPKRISLRGPYPI